MEGTVAVIGSVNIDIGGYPCARPLERDSTPGRVRFSVGGVGGNIARNLARIGMPVRFLTALGGDPHRALIERALEALGVDLSLSLRVPEENTSTYLYIADEHGDMRMAISDMGISRHQTCAYFERMLPALNACSAVVLDANLSEESIGFLAGHLSVPLFADAVSAAKALRLRGALGRLCAFKPNRIEAELLSGVTITDIKSADEAAKKLLKTGLERVFITLGPDGTYCADACEALYMPAFAAKLQNATGAGDAFTAAIVWAWMNGCSLRESCRIGSAAAAITAEAEETVSEALSISAIREKIRMEESQ